MHMRLFGDRTRRMSPITDVEMWRLLRELRTYSVFEPFRLWLAGSRLRPGKVMSDIDIVLSPRAGFTLSDQIIERGLWFCRDWGLHSASPACLLDPCFRAGGPRLDVVPLLPHEVLKGIKLFSPKIMSKVLSGQIREFRRIGLFSIEYCRVAVETSYYRKLPRRNFGGHLFPYLRRATEIPFQASTDTYTNAPSPRGHDMRLLADRCPPSLGVSRHGGLAEQAGIVAE